jgi:hypothetical protein
VRRSAVIDAREAHVALGLLTVTIALAPVWWTRVVSIGDTVLTLGRLALVVTGVFLALELARAIQKGEVVYEWPAILLCGSVAAFGVWMAINNTIWGCRCLSDFSGYIELITVLVYCVIAIQIWPGSRSTLVITAGFAGLLAAGLGLAGVEDLPGRAVNASAIGGRLAGTYGNANYLGFAISAAAPVLIAYLPRIGLQRRSAWLALAWLCCMATVAAALFQTYSRSAVVAASVGCIVTACLAFRSNRTRVAAFVISSVGMASVGLAIYGTFEESRQRVSLSEASQLNSSLDLGGWDGRAQGLIPRGGTRFRNDPRRLSLIVEPSAVGQGVSFEWGNARADVEYQLVFDARALTEPVVLAAGMEDNLRGHGPVSRVFLTPLEGQWRRLALSWIPRARSPSGRLYIWEPRGRSPFALRQIRIISDAFRPNRVKLIPLALRGSVRDAELQRYRAADDSARASRVKAAHLAVDAFAANPTRGIGWERFPDYAKEHAAYGRLATHNDYLRVAAELGVPGLVLFFIAAVTIIMGAARLALERADRAAVGLVATGAIGLLFLNGLVTPSATIPFAVAVAVVVCSPRGTTTVLRPDHQRGAVDTDVARPAAGGRRGNDTLMRTADGR